MSVTGPTNDTGPTAPTRSSRRTRRLTIIGALALVLVAGAVLVGVKTTGARSGADVSLCKDGGSCRVGDVGPGAGTVIIVAPGYFPCGTIAVPASCSYLEAAPAGWNTTTADPSLDLATAKTTASNYRGGDKHDWHLPTQEELKALYFAREGAGGLAAVYYWSSTASGEHYAWSQSFDNGSQIDGFEGDANCVRPVRVFGPSR